MRKIIACCLGCGRSFTNSLFKSWCSLECKITNPQKTARDDATILANKKKEDLKKERKRFRTKKRAIRLQQKKKEKIALAKKVLIRAGLLPYETVFDANSFYLTESWRSVRYKAIKRFGRCCMACGTKTGEMHVDHIKPRSKFPELELDVTNLQILCRDCNLGKSNRDQTDWRPKLAAI